MSIPAGAKPFPWKCGYCRQRSVQPATVVYSTEIEHDSRLHVVELPALTVARCNHCGEMVLDDAANRQISDALRRQLGLLFPDQISDGRKALSLTCRQLADRLGVTETTLGRWESGFQIQPSAVDRLLRVYFAFAEVRAALAEEIGLPQLGVTEQTTQVA